MTSPKVTSPKDGHAVAADDLNAGEVVPPCRKCGAPTVFDPNMVGETCGNLTRIGWMVCTGCGREWHAGALGREHEKWRVAGSGRSVEIGTGRIRIEGHPDPKALAARIAQLPELELEVARLRAAAKDESEVRR